MPTNFRVSSLIPTGLIVDCVVQDGDAIIVTGWRCALCVARSRSSAFTADISGRSRTSLAQGGVFAFASWHDAFAARPRNAGDRFSPNALTKPCSPSVRAGRGGSIAWFIILAWGWAAGRR
jgi:hypothetical protein